MNSYLKVRIWNPCIGVICLLCRSKMPEAISWAEISFCRWCRYFNFQNVLGSCRKDSRKHFFSLLLECHYYLLTALEFGNNLNNEFWYILVNLYSHIPSFAVFLSEILSETSGTSLSRLFLLFWKHSCIFPFQWTSIMKKIQGYKDK